jgi:uncharacterized protein YjaZ
VTTYHKAPVLATYTYGPIGITTDQILAVIPHEYISIFTIGHYIWRAYGEHIERDHLEALVAAGLLETYGPKEWMRGKSGTYMTQYYRKRCAERDAP